MFRMILETWLRGWGYLVTAVEDGAQAWALLQQQDPPRLVVADWMMPRISGIELCRMLRSERRAESFYILLATSRGHTEDLMRGLEAGADDYLSKPFDKDELYARLATGQRMLTAQGAWLRSKLSPE